MKAAFIARTQSGTFVLDPGGVCLFIVPHSGSNIPTKLIGAQFVASLDVKSVDALHKTPLVGAPMLFAARDESGRIFLLRTGKLLEFTYRAGDETTAVTKKMENKFNPDLTGATTAFADEKTRVMMPRR